MHQVPFTTQSPVSWPEGFFDLRWPRGEFVLGAMIALLVTGIFLAAIQP